MQTTLAQIKAAIVAGEPVKTPLRMDLRRADLSNENMPEANLTSANLTGADLTSADLTSANLTRANLNRTVLTHTNLSGANLTGADLTSANLTGVTSLRKTIGDGVRIRNYPSDTYAVCYTADVIQIGCKRYTPQQWRNFTDNEIACMAADALTWWRAHKQPLFDFIAANPATS